jgi:4-hydroxybenzoate polyprenyltransferase
MMLNVWTDRELDRERKPELFLGLTRNPLPTLVLLALEALSFTLAVLALFRMGDERRTAWLLAFSFLFNLYSFNFFVPHRGNSRRFKLYWWGNLLAAGGGYFTLWMSGFGDAWNSNPAPLTILAAFCATSEYAMFLGECATDAAEERAQGLRTLPAMFGRRGTLLFSIGVCFVLYSLWAFYGRALMAIAPRPTELRLAGDWYLSIAGITCLLLFFRARHPHRPLIWDRSVDVCFWLLRVGLLALILLRRGALVQR